MECLQELELASPTVQGKLLISYQYPLPWAAARSRCMADGGDLATIVSVEEHNMIVNQFPGRSIWIGLNDMSAEGTFQWADGDPSMYRNFYSWQPDDWQGREDCVHITGWMSRPGDGWNDGDCNFASSFVCAKCGGMPCAQVVSRPQRACAPFDAYKKYMHLEYSSSYFGSYVYCAMLAT